MIQVCDPPRTRQVRRLSTEEFCQLVRGEVSCVYRLVKHKVARGRTENIGYDLYLKKSVYLACKPFKPLLYKTASFLLFFSCQLVF